MTPDVSERLLAATAVLAEASDLDSFPSLALSVLTSVVANDLGVWNEIDPATDRAVGLFDPADAYVPGLEAAFERYGHQNPLYRRARDLGDTVPGRLSDHLSQEELHGLAFYEEVFRPLGTEFQLAVGIPSRPPQLIAITINRGDVDFDDAELEAVRLLQPHLMVAYDRCREHAGLRREAAGLRAAVEIAGLALVRVANGAVRTVTPRARALLASAGLTPEALAAQVPRLRTSAGTAVELGGLRVTALDGDGETVVIVEAETALPQRHPALTARELEVLTAAAEGLTALAVARRLGLSERTVHTHLRNAYRKLRASNLASALAALRQPPA